MSNLKKYRFCDLYTMSSGISTTKDQAGHGSPFLSFSVVFNNYFVPDELTDLMATSDKEKDTYSIKSGDIFLTRTSEVVDELAMSCVAIKDYPNASYSGFLKRLRPIQTDITYSKFMAFYLRSPMFRKTMTNNAVMTLRASLNEAIFSYLDLRLPDFDDQVKAGDLLYLLNEKIEINKRINAELEAMAKTLYDYWFVQFDFPDANGKTYKTSGGKMVYNPIIKRDIPEGWEAGTLEDLGQIVGGSTPSTQSSENFTTEGTPWITPNDLSNNQGNKFISRGRQDVSTEGIKSASLKKYPAGTVLLSSRAPIGYMAISRNEVTTNQGFKSFIPNKGYSSEFIYYTVKNSLKAITQYASGSTFKEVSGGTLKTVKVVLPKMNVSDAFKKKVQSIFSKQDFIERENAQLTQLRDWLLPMLMNGQVTVK
ncbi:restriction endonuclease subunit S [Aeromonas enteropelogenes]|uniref:restriction endonuclease subunit S n=1 Tax=Aeromonas enteropelogenes TaxID=29489 RepID=UPI00191D2B78|nr:restriction endonuclease subunit S [Aeromonas enteropelogenes]MBL0457861.1 restriction endonuclease subunit S [Aeromonas enteropelogenes]